MENHQNGYLSSRIKWVIELNPDRSAIHTISLNINNITTPLPSIPNRISIKFQPNLSITKCLTKVGENICNDDLYAQADDSKIYTCDLNEIVNSLENETTESLALDIQLKEENAFVQFSNIFMPDFYYECEGLKPYSVEVTVRLPKYNIVRYFWRRLFTDVRQKGIFKIHQIESYKSDPPIKIEGRRVHTLKYINQRISNRFPNIWFAFEPTGNVKLLTAGYRTILWIFSFLSAVAASILASKEKAVQVFDYLIEFISK